MLDEETNIRFFADSTTYEQAAIDLKDLTPLELVLYNPNYFGPITILNLMGGSRWGVLIFNLCIFTLSIILICKALSLNRMLFVILVIFNPMTFSSLLSINKEIFSILTVALLVYGTSQKSIFALFVCLASSFFVRWQLSFFVIVYFVLILPINPLRGRRFLTPLLFIIIISVLYYAVGSKLFSNISAVASDGGQQWDGSGLWGALLSIQDSGGYFIIFPIKVLHAMFGILAYINKIINPPEYYNYVVVMLHSLITLFVSIYAVINKKLVLANNVTYMMLIYLIIFGITPIYAPRYFYPVFLFLCILVAEKSFRPHKVMRLLNS